MRFTTIMALIAIAFIVCAVAQAEVYGSQAFSIGTELDNACVDAQPSPAMTSRILTGQAGYSTGILGVYGGSPPPASAVDCNFDSYSFGTPARRIGIASIFASPLPGYD